MKKGRDFEERRKGFGGKRRLDVPGNVVDPLVCGQRL
jgi:hypothetical protein